MADFAGLQTLTTTLQNVVTGIGQLTKQIATSTGAIFPQVQSTATTATAGSITPPTQVVGYIQVTLPSGTTVKVPYYGV